MKKAVLLFLSIVLGFFTFLSPVSAEELDLPQVVDHSVENTPVVDLSEDDTLYTEVINPREGILIPITEPKYDEVTPMMANHYSYKITKKEVWGRGWGSFRNGPSGRGPSTLSINQSKTLNRSFTNTLSGEFPIGKGKIGTSLGVEIGVAETYGTSSSIPVEAGKRKQIIYRPEYVQYRVTQRMYVNGIATNVYKYAYVNVFEDWDYDWKYLAY